MKKKIQRIGILTSGGDCPGLNAVIRAVTKKAILQYGYEVIGIKDGFEGLLDNRHRKLEQQDVSGILTLGGTILGTTNRANPFNFFPHLTSTSAPLPPLPLYSPIPCL